MMLIHRIIKLFFFLKEVLKRFSNKMYNDNTLKTKTAILAFQIMQKILKKIKLKNKKMRYL